MPSGVQILVTPVPSLKPATLQLSWQQGRQLTAPARAQAREQWGTLRRLPGAKPEVIKGHLISFNPNCQALLSFSRQRLKGTKKVRLPSLGGGGMVPVPDWAAILGLKLPAIGSSSHFPQVLQFSIVAQGDRGSLSDPPLSFSVSPQVFPFLESLTWPFEEELNCLLEVCVEPTAWC